MEVLILKTNIRYKKQLKTVAPLLDSKDNISRWNIDLNDIDKVLRIESSNLPIGRSCSINTGSRFSL